MKYLTPGDPTAEALFREEFANLKDESAETETSVIDHTAQKRVTLLRAHIAAGVGRFFA
jgi:hypothetical protein